jgi:hypothetical protein
MGNSEALKAKPHVDTNLFVDQQVMTMRSQGFSAEILAF